jgi:AmmeMemoRadiSam system protein B
MSLRTRFLPEGWYPDGAEEVRAELAAFEQSEPVMKEASWACAAIAPHAGWYFSGHCAWLAWRAASAADVAVVVGGHLPRGAAFLRAPADELATPLGPLRVDSELDAYVGRRLGASPDRAADNTVEIQLPMLKARFPLAAAAWFRAPNDRDAARLGEALAEYAKESGKRLFVLGSTDLTHYGPNYGWSPGGGGASGRAWAAQADKAIVEAYAGLDADSALSLADERAASCSVGAAIAALSYAKALGRKSGEVLELCSSADRQAGESFVGYAAIAY